MTDQVSGHICHIHVLFCSLRIYVIYEVQRYDVELNAGQNSF